MNREVLSKAKNLEERIQEIERKLKELNRSVLYLCNEFSSGALQKVMIIDDDLKEFVKVRLIMEKERLEKELQEL